MKQIATLIPAYNHQFLFELFAGLQSQTYRDFRVIICDDSPQGLITDQINEGVFDEVLKDLDFVVEPGGGGLWRNHYRALDVWAGSTPLVHIHMDDDVIYPQFYWEHMVQHSQRKLGATVSLRWFARSDGSPFATPQMPAFVQSAGSHALEIGAPQLFESTVPICENWLGELSNMVLSAAAARRFPRPPRAGVSYFGLPDIGLLLSAVDEGPLVLIRDHLSIFRRHEAQSTENRQSTSLKIAFVAWVAFALAARREKRIDDRSAIQSISIAAQRCYPHYASDPMMRPFFDAVHQHVADLNRFETFFSNFWLKLLSLNADTLMSDDPPPARF